MNRPDSGIVTVIQARTASTRLPNKVMRPLAGKPLLMRMVQRVLAAELTGKVVVATSTDPSDDAIMRLCHDAGYDCFRGSAEDLLDRHYMAGKQFDASAVIKIPSDCPLIDPQIIDRVISYFYNHPGQFDYASNLHPATYPDGNDVEIMTMEALETAWREAKRPLEREHCTPFLWDNPQRFRIGNVKWESGLDYSMSHRWTIDYEEDYRFINAVYDALFPVNPVFGLDDILNLLAAHPEIESLNSRLAGVNWYRNHLDELATITPEQTRQV